MWSTAVTNLSVVLVVMCRLPVLSIFASGTVIDVAYRTPKYGPCEFSYSEVLKSMCDMTHIPGFLFPKV